MATIAEQLTSLANTKTAIKGAIVAKGVQVSDDTPFSGYATKIGEISGGAPAAKFGATADTWIGDVDANGVLQKSTAQTALNFTGVTEIGTDGLYYAFNDRKNIISVDLSSVQTIGSSGMRYAFDSCSGLTGAMDISSLTTVGPQGMYYAFGTCPGITSVDLSSLTTVEGNGLQSAFTNCSGITMVDLSSLQSVTGYGMSSTFSRCTGLTTVSFPSLTSVTSSSLNNTFQYCTNITEIHFRADMQATIEAMSGYSSKFGATNATIYFDL